MCEIILKILNIRFFLYVLFFEKKIIKKKGSIPEFSASVVVSLHAPP